MWGSEMAKQIQEGWIQVFRSFDDQSARNAEASLKRAGIKYSLTRSTEGRGHQFKMVEFHVAPKDEGRAFLIIDAEINGSGYEPSKREERIL